MVLTKTAALQLKGVDAATRTFGGLASVYAPPDYGGDLIEPSAFSDSLAEYKRTGWPLPLVDQHGYESVVERVLGKVVTAHEVSKGLDCTFQLAETRAGEDALILVRGGYVNALSIGYMAVKEREPTKEERAAGARRVLLKISLQEVSLVMWPLQNLARIHTLPKARAKADPYAPGWSMRGLSDELLDSFTGRSSADTLMSDAEHIELQAKLDMLKLGALRLSISNALSRSKS